MNHARLDQLSDGIFAIVMTILVFEIRVPELSGTVDNQTLFNSLVNLLPIFISYLLGFSLLFILLVQSSGIFIGDNRVTSTEFVKTTQQRLLY
jgi:uncharacterized membrane protein